MYRTAQGGDLHCVSFPVFSIMPVKSFVVIPGDLYSGKDLCVFPYRPARTGIKFCDRHHSRALFTCQFQDCVQRKENRRTVRAGRTIADIAPDGSNIPYLRASHLVHGPAQCRDIPLYNRVIGEMGKCSGRADHNGPVRLHPDPFEGRDPMDAHQ